MPIATVHRKKHHLIVEFVMTKSTECADVDYWWKSCQNMLQVVTNLSYPESENRVLMNKNQRSARRFCTSELLNLAALLDHMLVCEIRDNRAMPLATVQAHKPPMTICFYILVLVSNISDHFPGRNRQPLPLHPLPFTVISENQ